MAYWETKVLAPTATPDRHSNQPTAFSGRREATIAPTVASITTKVLPNHHSKTGAFGCERLRTTRRALSPVRATVMVHSDQASQGAARVTILPLPRPRSLVPSVTTLILQQSRLLSVTATVTRWSNQQVSENTLGTQVRDQATNTPLLAPPLPAAPPRRTAGCERTAGVRALHSDR